MPVINNNNSPINTSISKATVMELINDKEMNGKAQTVQINVVNSMIDVDADCNDKADYLSGIFF